MKPGFKKEQSVLTMFITAADGETGCENGESFTRPALCVDFKLLNLITIGT